mgnify:CR=1 FL=1
MAKNIIPKRDLRELVLSVKGEIDDDCLAFEEDDKPGIQLTVGCDEKGDWNFQTGDNSCSGGAYGFPHWAVVGVYRKSNCTEVAQDLLDQLHDLICYE